MKRYFAIVLSVCLLFLSSCHYNYKVDGIENFDTTLTDFEVNLHILPDEEFVNRYPSQNIEYHFRQKDDVVSGVERSLIVVDYERHIYEQAKKHCLKTMSLSETVVLEYNGYTFVENVKLPTEQGQVNQSGFPHWFNMFAYNDAKCELVFLGIFVSHHSYDDAEDVKANWGEFVEEYFGDIHDWD